MQGPVNLSESLKPRKLLYWVFLPSIVHLRLHACMHACTYMCAPTHSHANASTKHSCIHMYVQKCTYVHTHTPITPSIGTITLTLSHTSHIHIHSLTYTQPTSTLTYISIHTQVQTEIHIHIRHAQSHPKWQNQCNAFVHYTVKHITKSPYYALEILLQVSHLSKFS